MQLADHLLKGVLPGVCVCVCDTEPSKMRRPRLELGNIKKSVVLHPPPALSIALVFENFVNERCYLFLKFIATLFQLHRL
jgi:hypothetical protein